MSNDPFFDESTDQSVVKAKIVTTYFYAWAKVVGRAAKRRPGRIAYVDLFAGPGRYKDGTQSTPLQVLRKAIADDDLREMLVTRFNDANGDHSRSLEQAIANLPGIERLKFAPEVMNDEVGETIVQDLERLKLVPTLSFVDPWGYKGLSLRLVNALLKDWGCDCIFFFNYNRISMGLNNDLVREHMNALFGSERADRLRQRLDSVAPPQRELMIVEELIAALKSLGGRYVIPFTFRTASGSRTSHHLFFVSKHIRGYEIMKGIMAKQSSLADQGVPSFAYSEADRRNPRLFEMTRPLDDLEQLLLERFAGECLTMKEVYDRHHVDTPFIKPNYKEALKRLEARGAISAEPSAESRRKGTFADKVLVTFP